ncbi:MAG: hypothetical protein WD649_02675 [Thermoleophilaceae bacterium]
MDHVPFHIRERQYGKPKQSGRLAFVVYGVLGYRGRRPYLHALRSYPHPSAANVTELLKTLPGEPHSVLSDQAPGILKGIRDAWPGEPGISAPFQFVCEYHLWSQVLPDPGAPRDARRASTHPPGPRQGLQGPGGVARLHARR